MRQQLWYIDIPDRAFDETFLDEEWFDWVLTKAPMCCGLGCGAVRPEYYGVPATIVVARPPAGHYQAAPMASLVSDTLRDILEPKLHDPVWGRCKLPSGEEIDQWHTVYSPSSLSATLRGGPGTRYRRCRYCGLERIGRRGRSSDETRIELPSILEDREAVQILAHSGFAVSDHVFKMIRQLQLEGIRMGVELRND